MNDLYAAAEVERRDLTIGHLRARIAQLEAALRELRMDIENTGHIGLLVRMRFHRIIDTALGSSVETTGEPLKGGKPLSQYIAEQEQDPKKKRLLDEARSRLKSKIGDKP